ncbi:hypothetical protein D3C80_612700 [compost metagenome]
MTGQGGALLSDRGCQVTHRISVGRVRCRHPPGQDVAPQRAPGTVRRFGSGHEPGRNRPLRGSDAAGVRLEAGGPCRHRERGEVAQVGVGLVEELHLQAGGLPGRHVVRPDIRSQVELLSGLGQDVEAYAAEAVVVERDALSRRRVCRDIGDHRSIRPGLNQAILEATPKDKVIGLLPDRGLELGERGTLTGQGIALTCHGGVQRLKRRGIGLVRHLRQSAGTRRCSIGRHFVGDGHPGTPVPAFGRIRRAGRVDPQVLSLTVGHRRHRRLVQHLTLAPGQTGRSLSGLLSRGNVAVGGLQTVVELGDAAALARQRVALIRHRGAQRLQRRCISLAGQLRQCRLRSRGGILGHLVRHSHPSGAVPTFRSVGITRGIDPKVLRQAISRGGCGRLHQHLAFTTRDRGRILGCLLGSGDVLIGGGKAAAQRCNRGGVCFITTDPGSALVYDRSDRRRRRDLADGDPVDFEHIAGRRAEPQVEPGDRAVRPVAATIGQL